MTSAVTQDLIIIGAGPAGVAAAQQAFRDRIAAVVVTATPPGGAVRAARTLTNLPGFDHPITGTTLAKRLLDSLRATGIPVVTDRVVSLEQDSKLWRARLAGGARLDAKAVILATGTSPLPAPFPGWSAVERAGLGHRDASTLPDHLEGRTMTVIGGGDVAFDTALIALDRGAGQVRLLVRNALPRAARHLLAEASARGVVVITETKVLETTLISQTSVSPAARPHDPFTKVRLHIEDGSSVDTDLAALCIGRRAADDLVADMMTTPPTSEKTRPHKRDTTKKTKAQSTAAAWDTNLLPPGLWLAGDVASSPPGRFIAWALGSGQQAAVRAAAYLRSQGS